MIQTKVGPGCFVNEATVFEIEKALIETVGGVETPYTPEELAIAAFRFVRSVCVGTLRTCDNRAVHRDTLKDQCSTLLLELADHKRMTPQ